MDGWDIALFVAAAYVAALALVRQMIGRRDMLLSEVRKQIEAENRRREAG